MVEKMMQEKKYIKDIFEQTLELNQFNYSHLRKDVDVLFGSNAILTALINGYEYNNTYDLLISEGFNEEFSIWLWKLSIKYGRNIWNEIEKGASNYDWKELSMRLIINEESLLELDITRYDEQKFKLEMDIYSALQLIDRIAGSIEKYYTSKDMDEKDNELLESIIEKLNKNTSNLDLE